MSVWKLIGIIDVALLCLVFGCVIGSSQPVKPASEFDSAMKEIRKDIDKSKRQYDDIQGNVTAIEQRMTQIETTVNNTQIQNTQNETTNNNESLVSIIWTFGLLFVIIRVLEMLGKFLHVAGMAKRSPGSTIKNLIFGQRDSA